MTSTIFHHIDGMQSFLQRCRKEGKSIAFVPTLGGLHEGHLSLVRIAAMKSEQIVISIFLNERQFNDPKDYARYPVNLEKDIALIDTLGLNTVIYAPKAEEIYPEDFATKIHLPELEHKLCGMQRPGHFSSVATIVVKLLLQILPDYAIFGGKDFQQLRIIRQVCKDLSLPCYIIAGSTVREPDGLACSSRNLNLTPEHRRIAPFLYDQLCHLAKIAQLGNHMAQPIEEAQQTLLAKGFESIDYLGLYDTIQFNPVDKIDLENYTTPARIFGAAMVGGVRLIDNVGILVEP